MMETALKLALWIHLISLSLGGAATFGVPAIGAAMGGMEGAQRKVLAKALLRLASLGRMALVLLVLTGVFLWWGRYGSGLGPWFHVKMALVLVMVALAVYGPINGKKAAAGDAAAVARLPMLWLAMMVTVAGVVLAAVMTFN